MREELAIVSSAMAESHFCNLWELAIDRMATAGHEQQVNDVVPQDKVFSRADRRMVILLDISFGQSIISRKGSRDGSELEEESSLHITMSSQFAAQSQV